MKIELGSEVQDTITKLKGVATGYCQYLNGCTQIGVQGKCQKDGTIPDVVWVDEPQIKLIKKTVTRKKKARVGGPRPSPKRRSGPR